jgi:predicted outer membrane repeat protein
VIVALVPVLLGAAYIWGFYAPSPTTVTSLNNSGQGSLRDVLAKAPAGATITFSPALRGQTIQLTDNFKLERNVTIQGFQDKTPIISSGQTGKGISIEKNADVTFNSITFADSYTHRASLITNRGVLTLNDCLLTRNKSYGLGGGAIANRNRLILNNTTLTLNQTSGNGGAIHDLFGIMTVNNSRIIENTAYNNGGGIYTQGGHIEIIGGEVSKNHAQLLQSQISNNYGGGIDVVNGSLTMFSTDVSDNTTAYYGGGIALQGSIATIKNAKIHENTAGVKGGGLIVTKDTDNNFASLATLSNMVVAGKPAAQYYIGRNQAGPDMHKDEVAGQQTSVGDTIQIADDDNVAVAGNPPPNRETPPEQTANYLGIVPIYEFCQNEGYSSGEIRDDANVHAVDGQNDIQVLCALTLNENDTRSHYFFGKEVCRLWFAKTANNATIVDRLTNYFDPSSLQCYKNLKLVGPIGNNPADFDAQCKKDPINEGLYDNQRERQTAYDWSCQPKDHKLLPIGLSVANACDTKYPNVTNAIDRLVNYNSPAGWECWQPV